VDKKRRKRIIEKNQNKIDWCLKGKTCNSSKLNTTLTINYGIKSNIFLISNIKYSICQYIDDNIIFSIS